VECHKDREIDVAFIRELAHFIWQLQKQGVALSPHLRLVAAHRNDRESYLSPISIHRNQAPPLVRTLLGMNSNRGYHSTNVKAGKLLPSSPTYFENPSLIL
jgi:hypothetical protein